MNRRDFLHLSGLGALGLLFSPASSPKLFLDDERANALVEQTLNYLLQNGAVYADVRLGACEIHGNTNHQDALLVKKEFLGVRICTQNDWRYAVIVPEDESRLEAHLSKCLTAKMNRPKPESGQKYWVTAHFDHEICVAKKSSDPETEEKLNSSMIRYGEPHSFHSDSPQILFCDLIIEH